MSTETPAAAPPATEERAAPAPAPVPAPAPAAAPESGSRQQQPQQPPLPPRNSQFAQYPSAYGQQYQPFQQYGMQPMNVPRWSGMQQQIPPGSQVIQPPPVTETKAWVMSKMVMHAFGFIFALVILGLGITFVDDWSIGYAMLIMNCTLAGLCLLWSASELILRAGHHFKRGIHPGAHVALTLIIWLCAAVVGGFATAITVSATMYDGYWGSYDCDYTYSPYSSSYDEDCEEPTGRNAILVASTVFSWFIFIIYFVLFVLACIDTSRFNAAKNRPIMIVQQNAWGPQMSGPGGMAPPPNTYYQHPQHPQQPHHHPVAAHPRAPRQSMPPPQQQQQQQPQQTRAPVHTASGALPAETTTRRSEKQAEASSSNAAGGIQEYYTPGTTS